MAPPTISAATVPGILPGKGTLPTSVTRTIANAQHPYHRSSHDIQKGKEANENHATAVSDPNKPARGSAVRAQLEPK